MEDVISPCGGLSDLAFPANQSARGAETRSDEALNKPLGPLYVIAQPRCGKAGQPNAAFRIP